MIEIKHCKGQNKAHGANACGKPTDVKKRKYGLCPVCYWDWMQSSETGKVHYQKQFLPTVKKNTETQQRKDKIEKKKKAKASLMTADKYRAQIIQPMINKIARLIDHGHPCIASGQFGKMNGGHYISVGANRTTALHLHNIHIQSFESNHFKSGDTLNYQNGIREVYGQKYLDYMDSLKRIKPIHFTKQDYIELNPKCKYVIDTLNKQLIIREPFNRIRVRNWANGKLDVYSEDMSFYPLTKLQG